MSIPRRYKPTDEKILSKYYDMWCAGNTESEIRKGLELSSAKFKSLLPDFMNYVRHRVRHDTRGAMAAGDSPDKVKVSEDRRKELVEKVRTGVPLDKVAMTMNVPLVTILDVWFRDDPVLKHEVEAASEEADIKVINALFKRATGQKYNQVTKTVSEAPAKDETGKEMVGGATVKTVTTSTTEKFVLPDVKAIENWLFNRRPKEWSKDGTGNRSGSRGAILEFLDKLIGGEAGEAEREDEEFEEG